MSAPLWVHELASFWRGAAAQEPAPHDLRDMMVRTLPLTAVELPNLRVTEIDGWLRRQGIECGLHAPDRSLYACLVAHKSHGAVFLDCRDPEAEQRFSLAHELAHFLHDYWKPRLEAVNKYGPAVLEVFDGKRPPRPEERIHALLAKVPIGFRVHLMDRAPGGVIANAAIAAAEAGADRLAFELLAPEDEVLARIDTLPAPERRAAAGTLLQETYGLPAEPAARYAALLVPERARSFTRRLWAVQ